MGRDKALIETGDGIRFIDHALDRLGPLCDKVCLSGASDYDTGSTVVADIVPDTADAPNPMGPAVAVISVLKHGTEESFDGCLFTPVDMPYLTRQDLMLLRDAWKQDPQTLVCGISDNDRILQPLVAIYPASCCNRLQEAVVSGQRSLRRWIKNEPHTQVTLSDDACRNLNRPEDLS